MSDLTVEKVEFHERNNQGVPSLMNIILKNGSSMHGITAYCQRADAEAVAKKMGLELNK